MTTSPPGDPQETVCPRCGAASTPAQEYCLECGLRLGAGRGVTGRLSAAWRERFGWYPGAWVWPALLGLVIAVLGATAAIVVADSGNGNAGPLVATEGGRPQNPAPPTPTETVALPTVPSGTPTTTGPPPTRTTPPPATTPAPRPGALVQWPAARNGYTVVLESIPSSAGRSYAASRARSASRAGLPQVGVLDSSRFSSLHPGYYVVFSGIYGSKAEADRGAAAAGGKDFASAHSRQISR